MNHQIDRSVVLSRVCHALHHKDRTELPERPLVVAPRLAADPQAEIEMFLLELGKLSAKARRLVLTEMDQALQTLVLEQEVRRAAVCTTPELLAFGIAGRLAALGVEVLLPGADKHALAGCELGVSGADFVLPETGTLGLLASNEQPRAFSLLPRVHLAVVRPSALRADLHAVFAEASRSPYLVLISGPSRTSDIELTLTLGVHGPRSLYVWMLDE